MIQVDDPAPHALRARSLLRQHPEIRKLFGPTRATAALAIALVGVQFALAAVAASLPWWGAGLLAFGLGAFVSHALYAVLHECAHRLAARSKIGNRVVALIANLPLLVPIVDGYAHFHRMHHRHQGDPSRDPDLPLPAEVALAQGRVGRLIWHLTFPFWQLLRTARLPGPPCTRWTVANAALQLAAVGLVAKWGMGAVFYLALSFLFTMAGHPLSARLVQEHHLVDPHRQETTSYAGPLNWIALNVGLHNEHHDFPAVPWTRLPALRRLGAKVYEGELASHRSWLRLWWRSLADPRAGPHRRIVRSPRYLGRRGTLH